MEFLERHYISTDWISILILFVLGVLVLAKILFPQRFEHFTKLAYSRRYFQNERLENQLTDSFSLLLYIGHIISISLFLYVAFSLFGVIDVENPKSVFVQILLAYTLFFSFKYFFEKILGEVFNMQKTINNYIFSKISFRNYLAFFLLPVTILLVYSLDPTRILIWIIIGFFLLINLIFLLGIYQKNRALISRNWFYFILYLCAFEIAPYFILFKSFEIV